MHMHMPLPFKVKDGGYACIMHDVTISYDVMHDIIQSSHAFINMCVCSERVYINIKKCGSLEKESLREA